MATSRMPAAALTIWLARPRPMNPAPIIPTRIGRPCASRARSALSMMIIAVALGSHAHRRRGQAHARADSRLRLVEQRPGAVLVRDVADRQRPRDAQPRIRTAHAAFRRRGVELTYLVG